MATAQRITKDQFDEFIEPHGFVCVNDEQTREELRYVLMWGDSMYKIEIYSSIDPVTETTRDKGVDAIRLVLSVRHDRRDHIIGKSKRVHRVKGWKMNLYQRINELKDKGCFDRNQECEKCGAPMIMREGPYGKFAGCYMFPVTGCDYKEKA